MDEALDQIELHVEVGEICWNAAFQALQQCPNRKYQFGLNPGSLKQCPNPKYQFSLDPGSLEFLCIKGNAVVSNPVWPSSSIFTCLKQHCTLMPEHKHKFLPVAFCMLLFIWDAAFWRVGVAQLLCCTIPDALMTRRFSREEESD